MNKTILAFASLLFLLPSCSRNSSESDLFKDKYDLDKRIQSFNDIHLEMSLKPFKVNNRDSIDQVCRNVFIQWAPLLRHADTISVMLWTADGSEILNYTGDDNQRLEWSQYVGNPNTDHEVNSGPKELSLHQRAYDYIQNPPQYTYGDLKYIVSALKRHGERLTGKVVRIGETFDPGPEFAKSEFKYKKHPEICMGNTMGAKTFVCCYATLNEDKEHYAGYPSGIPQGTPFGTFFGKQSQHFLTDMGFDFLWFSNGLGFGMETWGSTGAVFDGKQFHPEKLNDTREKITDFWNKFRAECPDIRIETRGTNISVGADLAKDGVDLKAIYNGNFNLLPPPNSPWAALDGNFGLELAGYMSRISELPDDRYLFRYYIHDPWWANSPWLDRYGREAHDIYLPMAVARIDREGKVKLPTHFTLLTIDDSYGNMPEQVPSEMIPHLLQGRRTAPDQPGLIVWVYPFDEYHDWAHKQPERVKEIYYGDWFIQQAINDGFPLNTVVSTGNFVELMKAGKKTFDESILVSIVPDAGSDLEKQLIQFVKKGGKLFVYGPSSHASQKFLDFLNIKQVEPISGEMRVQTQLRSDLIKTPGSSILRHNEDMSGGGIETLVNNTSDPSTKVLAQAFMGAQKRDIAIQRQEKDWNGGMVVYLRGTNSATYRGGHLLTPDNPKQRFNGSSLLRYSLNNMGYSVYFDKLEADMRNPINCISRNDNAFYFSGFTPNQTIEQQWLFPQGAPIFTGYETELRNGIAHYRMPKSYQEECRVFVKQEKGIISCYEVAPVEWKVKRRIGINGLKQATVRIYPGVDDANFKVVNNIGYPYNKPSLELKKGSDFSGTYYEFTDITGELIAVW